LLRTYNISIMVASCVPDDGLIARLPNKAYPQSKSQDRHRATWAVMHRAALIHLSLCGLLLTNHHDLLQKPIS